MRTVLIWYDIHKVYNYHLQIKKGIVAVTMLFKAFSNELKNGIKDFRTQFISCICCDGR